MESWGYTFVGKDFISDDSTSGNSEIPRNHSKNGLMGCELKSPWSYGTTMVSSTQEVVENQPFSDLNSSEMMRISDILAPTNDFSLENQSSSRDSSSLIDLKLGRLNDYRDSKNLAESSMTVKRARGGAYSSHIPYCQVHGCKKDLSSSKDYHKRHKVCEIHSKTSQVIVNGIEQRFCQQCSRFHLLSEFDDGKRSCRKRLAGHNERRRKPHMRIHSDKSGKLFQSINATSFKGNTSYDSSRIMKIEDGVDRFTSGPLFGSRDLGKQSTSIHDEGISVITRNNMYVHEIEDSDYMSRSILHHSSGNSDMRVSESHSNRALSLLSSSSTTSLPVITSGSRANALFSFGSMMNNHVDENHLNYQPILNGMIEESEYINRKNEDDPTINLLDLSSQMQRVEHQRQTMLMKMENDAFSDLKIT